MVMIYSQSGKAKKEAEIAVVQSGFRAKTW